MSIDNGLAANPVTAAGATPDPAFKRDDRVEACKTYIEQTKLLVTLASALIVAPAGLLAVDKAKLQTVAPILWTIAVAEVCFAVSVLAGYIVLGTIAGSQDAGTFDVYRPATTVSSLIQLGFYLAGLTGFVFFVVKILA